MASASSLLRSRPAPALWTALLLLPLAPTGCSEGQNSDDGPMTTLPIGTTANSDSSSSEATPTTTDVAASTSGTSTGDETTGSSTGMVTTTTDPGSSSTTEPICDPGQGNCVCDNGQCVDGFVCELDVCVPGPMVCPGDLEPGDDAEDSATNVGSITDDDGEAFTVSGVLSGADDVDWFTYHGKDTFGYVAEPTLNLVEGAQRLCQFIVCDEGGAALTTLTCPDNAKSALSPMLRPGCCADTSFTLKDFNCQGQDESVTVWVRVDKPVVDECTNYEFKLNF